MASSQLSAKNSPGKLGLRLEVVSLPSWPCSPGPASFRHLASRGWFFFNPPKVMISACQSLHSKEIPLPTARS